MHVKPFYEVQDCQREPDGRTEKPNYDGIPPFSSIAW